MTEFVQGKVIMVGDTQVGKTSLINCFNRVENGLTQPTVPVSTIACSLQVGDKTIHFNIWDTAGQENYKCLLPMYFRNSQLAVLVFDLSRNESYQNVDEWISYIREHLECQIIIVGNKADLPSEVDIDAAKEKFAKANYEFYITSATNGNGIDILFQSIALTVDKNSDRIEKPVSTFQQPIAQKENSDSCC